MWKCYQLHQYSKTFPKNNSSKTMQFRTRKMNNISNEDLPVSKISTIAVNSVMKWFFSPQHNVSICFQQKVGEMHSLLMMISSELSNIRKQLNAESKKYFLLTTHLNHHRQIVVNYHLYWFFWHDSRFRRTKNFNINI